MAVPSLRERLDDDPGELGALVRDACRRILGEEALPGARPLVEETLAWVDGHLGPRYPWPGNVREVEQCVRNVLVRGAYAPPPLEERPGDPFEETVRGMREGTLAADAVLDRYCARVYARTGSWVEAARVLRLDRRTVKAHALGRS